MTPAETAAQLAALRHALDQAPPRIPDRRDPWQVARDERLEDAAEERAHDRRHGHGDDAKAEREYERGLDHDGRRWA